MVCTGERERGGNGGGGVSNMEKGTSSGRGGSEERSLKAPLHNFNLPSFLKWGNQRLLRRIKLPDHRTYIDGTTSPTTKTLNTASATNHGIDAVREEIMFDLKTAADRMKDAIFRKEATVAAAYSSSSSEEGLVMAEKEGKEETNEARRWNLRTRRGSAVSDKGVSPAPVVVAGFAVGVVGGGGRRFGSGGDNSSPKKKGENGEEVKKREKLVVELTRKEIEDDFMQMVGRRPARRPKKRHRNVQRQLDTLFPGLWLTDVTVDTYKVPDPPVDNGKK